MSASSTASYKTRKEAFVSNLSGSSFSDINVVTAVAPAAVLLWSALQRRRARERTTYNAEAWVIDILLNVFAILLAFTAYSSFASALNFALVAPATMLILGQVFTSQQSRMFDRKSQPISRSTAHNTTKSGSLLPNRPFITHYRGAMMISTCIGILAVDFPVFPRRFAKVETWGTSLMDLGVGSFVYSAGVVSARQIFSNKTRRPALLQRLGQSARSSIPLLMLGLIRLYSVKGLDYAEHVTEYGVHWNFFFTLALLPPFAELSDTVVRLVFRSNDVLTVVIAFTYEVILNSTDLLAYILVSPRGPSLLSKNREGVFSFIGYLAIFLSGRSAGKSILPLRGSKNASTKFVNPVASVRQDRRMILQSLISRALLYSGLLAFTVSYYTGNLQVSRRLANAPYVFWISAFNSAQLTIFALVEFAGPPFVYPQTLAGSTSKDKSFKEPVHCVDPSEATSKIMRAFNSNGLFVFLLANLMTGAVNIFFNTLDTSNTVAMCILSGYIAILTMVAVLLNTYGLRIKI